ncbi:hypothetical protein [Marinicauda sp. Alg238-R41]|jgi:hypothetical protein|uniref:hypothetical protein n=1 Tax=Marinicauda sp. Alg238-R41 TaxID=2993447 RepID=UPI0022E5C7CD|nr:hypothetical protein [Marinicauda sp. Alg238-R41]
MPDTRYQPIAKSVPLDQSIDLQFPRDQAKHAIGDEIDREINRAKARAIQKCPADQIRRWDIPHGVRFDGPDEEPLSGVSWKQTVQDRTLLIKFETF